MRRFVDDNGIYEIIIPVTWKYSLVDDHVHTFSGFGPNQNDCFQLSLKRVNIEEKKEFAHLFGFLPPKEIDGIDYRLYPNEEHENGLILTKAWVTIIGDDIILFSLTYYKGEDENKNENLSDEELEMVYSAIGSFNLIPEDERQRKLNSYRFEMFLQGIGATQLILNNAVENKAFIEATCILANQVDSLLRTAIVLQNQLINKNDKIDLEWIYQGPADKKKSEKDIYKKAKELNIIDEEICNELFELYEDRNRVIHRFIISEITLAEVELIAYDYYELRERIKIIADDLESEQLRLNIGMTTTNEDDPGNKSHFLHSPLGKIGKLDFFDQKDK